MARSENRFAGKAVLVTGAASGIGRAAAVAFGAEGAQVACVDLNEEDAKGAAEEIENAGGTAIAVPCNVADEADVESAVAATVEAFGGIDVLAHIAGLGGFRRLDELDLGTWSRMIDVNLTGTYLFARKTLPHLLERGGNIVNMASMAGLKGQPYSAHYCASKGGVVRLTRALSNELSPQGVRVNAVAPGGVRTPLMRDFSETFPEGVDLTFTHKLGPTIPRLSDPDEIAGSVLFLASEEAKYITGAILSVDGGVLA